LQSGYRVTTIGVLVCRDNEHGNPRVVGKSIQQPPPGAHQGMVQISEHRASPRVFVGSVHTSNPEALYDREWISAGRVH
jgi:hypothetical protein